MRRWTILCVGLAVAASCTSTYCLIGYIQYKHGAEDERLAAERAERANIDLQATLDRLRDDLALAEAQLDIRSEAKTVIAAKRQAAIKISR